MAHFSGVNEQMITLWNKKYGIFHEDKITATSKFSALDLKKLQNVAMLTNLNPKYKISTISQLSVEELSIRLEFELQNYLKNESDYEDIIGLLIIFLLTFDSPSFENILSLVIRQLGIEKCFSAIIYPILERLGILSNKKTMISVARQRFAMNILRKFFYFLIKNTARPVANERKWVLFLTNNHYQDLYLLYSCLVLKQHGETIIYLGEDISLSTLEECAISVNPTHFLTYISPLQTENPLSDYSHWIEDNFPEAVFIVSGNKSSFAQLEIDTIHPLFRPEDLRDYIDKLII